MAFIKEIDFDGAPVQGICILKSESVVPFLSISARNGDLEISTEQGINPDKIDKGCLILDHKEKKGYHVLTFDRSGSDSQFWVRDFLSLQPIRDAAYLTKKYTAMCSDFIEKEAPKKKEKTIHQANDALEYIAEKENFNLKEFEQDVLKEPEMVKKFEAYKAEIEAEEGAPFEEEFTVSKKDVVKAQKKIRGVLKLDTGIEIHIKNSFTEQDERVIERGLDEKTQMKFIKVYYNEEI